jgi:hypothetical protein
VHIVTQAIDAQAAGELAVYSPVGIWTVFFTSGAYVARWTDTFASSYVTLCLIFTVTFAAAQMSEITIRTFLFTEVSSISRTAVAGAVVSIACGSVLTLTRLATVVSVGVVGTSYNHKEASKLQACRKSVGNSIGVIANTRNRLANRLTERDTYLRHSTVPCILSDSCRIHRLNCMLQTHRDSLLGSSHPTCQRDKVLSKLSRSTQPCTHSCRS